MSRALAGLALALALAACSAPGGGSRVRGPVPDLPRTANPSAVVAAELAFARAAQDKGQWTAFAEYAADDATMFVPEPVNAKQWLKGRANPARAVEWQPHQVWSSCDGTLAVTKGAWQRPDGSVGYFTTVWQRQAQTGEYKWVMDQGDTLAESLKAPEFVIANVADCGSSPRDRFDSEQADWEANSEAADFETGGNESDDLTLAYRYRAAASGAREVEVFLLRDGSMIEVMRSEVAAP